MKWTIGLLAVTALFAGCISDAPTQSTESEAETNFIPHVIVGVPDSGINPYHSLYFRENLTEHPCTYIQDFPCSLPALNLTVGGNMTFEERMTQDADVWASVVEGQFYWIPQTVFVAAGCESPYSPAGGAQCILDDSHMHGTGTTSSVIMENPDALIAFKEGGSSIEPIMEAGIPVDIYSVSWGYIVPIPVNAEGILDNTLSPIYVLAAGNDPRSVLMDSWAGSPYVISVGGAYAEGQTQEPNAANQAEVVSYFCRPVAQTRSVDEIRESYCGTSFATPTTAGGLSKVILALRESSGYTGSIERGMVDPTLNITVEDLRDALNRTATYDPEAQYSNSDPTGIPLNPVAPWVQWGWGFYDGLVANATIDHFLVEEAPEKPMAAQLHMQAMMEAKRALHG